MTSTPGSAGTTVALVTGGTSGIGAAVADRLSADGFDVVTLARTKPTVTAHRFLQTDVTDRASLEAVRRTLESEGATIGVLVTAAGTNVRAPALEVSDSDIRRMIDVNLYGTIASFQVFAPLMLQHPNSRFVAIGSVSGAYGMNLRAVYGATKAAVSGLVRSLAIEWAPHGATVNAVGPGVIDTPLTAGYIERFPARAQALIDHTPVGRLGVPQDVAATVSFLASEGSSFITGQTIYPDGGLSAGCSWW
ncbi:MAG TPA: SDR family oxidoreductase [Microbacterium sp.]|uniref:SDR family NAD(P)-dependent oxidoreductase n=1 Tax=Microbacterium sp. TaxID=51671 RepID=UPI002BCEF4DA|nr:SDR family oxidoreductase [Microbacterium sp.]HWI32227.1 SDR family oxidoreductase [Microbacterium sp.]